MDQAKGLDRAVRVAYAIERQGLLVSRGGDAVEEIGVLLVEISAILENERRHVARRRGRVDATPKAVTHEARQIARVIEMGLGENDCIAAGGRDRQRFPIASTQIFHALTNAAIVQDALAVVLAQMFRTGDGSG